MDNVPGYFLFSVALLLVGLVFVLPLPSNTHQPIDLPANLFALMDTWPENQHEENTNSSEQYIPSSLTAEAAVIYDPLSGTTRFEKRADTPYGIASITKIMTGLVALERVGKNDIVRVHEQAVRTEGREGNLAIDEHLTLEDLIAIMMTESSNDAAVAIAEHVGMLYGASSFEESQRIFVEMMNTKARELGLLATYFQNPTGLDLDEETGILSNISTARDIAKLTAYALRYETLWQPPHMVLSKEGLRHDLFSTHVLALREAGILGGKTGFTDTAGGTLVTIAEVPLGELSIIVILGSGAEDRFSDTIHLLTYLRS